MPPESIGNFAQFGIAGLVIYSLFRFLDGFLKELKGMNETHDKRIENMAKTHYESIESMNEMHNERHDNRNDRHAKERDEWLVAYKENTSVLRTLSERKCPSNVAMERKKNDL